MTSLLTAFVNGAIAGTILTAIVWLGLQLTPRRLLNAATRYTLWWVTLAVVALLPLLYLPRTVQPPVLPASPTRSLPAVRPIEPETIAVMQTESLAPESEGAAGGFHFPLPVPAGAWAGWISGAGVLLIAAMCGRLLLSWLLLLRTRRSACPAPGHLAAQLQIWLEQCGGPRQVRLAVSERVTTPMVTGLFQPMILMPAALLEQLSAEEISHIGLHETAHLARRDHFALLLQRVLQALLAWHPAVKWIAREIDFEREIACDDFVLRSSVPAAPYALCLTRVVELAGAARGPRVALAATQECSRLSKRVDLLLDRTRHSGTRLLKAPLAVALAGLTALVWLGTLAPQLMAVTAPHAEHETPARRTAPPAPIEAPAPVLPVAHETTPEPPSEAPAPPPQAPQESGAEVRVGGHEVVVAVTVLEPQGRIVTGLTAANFRVFDGEVEQSITRLEQARDAVSLAIVVDASGSTRARVEDLRRAVADVLKKARPEDEFSLVLVHETPLVATVWTPDAAQVEARLNAEEPAGGTALRDGIALGLQQLRQSHKPSRALLIVSAGEDNTSGVSEDTLRQQLAEADLQVFAISFLDGRERRNPAFLTRIAGETGGWRFSVLPGGNFSSTAPLLLFPNNYMLRFQPKGVAMDGKFHPIRVLVTPPAGLPALTVKTRTGYYAPPR